MPCVLSVFLPFFVVRSLFSLTAFQNQANTRNLLSINVKIFQQASTSRTKDFVFETTEIERFQLSVGILQRIVINIEIRWVTLLMI